MSAEDLELPDLIEVGYVARAHGVRGELRVHLHNRDSEALLSAEVAYVNGAAHAIERARAGPGEAVLLSLEGVTGRDAAEALRGATVSLPRDDVAAGDEVLVAELIGCAVELEDGTPWGTVAAFQPGAQDRLVIHHGEVERLLPLVDAFIVDIDLERRVVVVAPPEGLPEEPIGR